MFGACGSISSHHGDGDQIVALEERKEKCGPSLCFFLAPHYSLSRHARLVSTAVHGARPRVLFRAVNWPRNAVQQLVNPVAVRQRSRLEEPPVRDRRLRKTRSLRRPTTTFRSVGPWNQSHLWQRLSAPAAHPRSSRRYFTRFAHWGDAARIVTRRRIPARKPSAPSWRNSPAR